MKRVTQTYRCPLIALAVFALFVLPTPAMADTCTSTGSGNWNTAATWSCSHVPTSSDDVVIADGHTVTIDTDASAASITVGQGASGVLTFDSTVRSVTVAGNVTINSGGTFIAQASGTATHSLSIGGDLTNNGRFDMSQGGSTLICNVTFGKNGSQTISGSGATFRFNNITLNMGTSNANVLDVQAVITMASDGLVLNNGTFKLSSASTITPFAGSTTIGSTAGFYLNHASATSNWGSTGSLTVNGALTIAAGTMTIGSGDGNELEVNGSSATTTVSGGTLRVAGRIRSVSSGLLTVSGGEIVVPTVTHSSANASFHMQPSGKLAMNGGTVTIQRANGGSGGDIKIESGSGSKSITGGTFQVGNASTPASQTILVNSAIAINNLTVNSANATAKLAAVLTLNGSVNISAGTLDANNLNIALAGDWSNSGTYTSGSETVSFNKSGTQTFAGSTIFNSVTVATGSTLRLAANADFGYKSTFELYGTFDATANSPTTVTIAGTSAQTLPTGATTLRSLTINSGSSLTAPGGTMNVAGNWTNSGTFTHNSGKVTFNGSGTSTFSGSSTTTFYDLEISSSSTILDVSTNTLFDATNSVRNKGQLKQTQTVSSGAMAFLNVSSGTYYGVVITPTSSMGSTTVTIYGEQACSEPPNIGAGGTLILRCYTITPATTANATTRFWYDTTYERNGLSQSAVQIFHEETSPALWRLQGDRSYGSSGSDNFRYVQVSTTSYSRFAGGVEGTNLIALVSFTAAPLGRGVLLAWQTASELDTAGFNLWRSDAADGPYARVNEALIPAAGGPTWGASYTFTDVAVVEGATCYYKLEEVDVYGLSAFHGPTAVTPGMAQGRRYLPLMGR